MLTTPSTGPDSNDQPFMCKSTWLDSALFWMTVPSHSKTRKTLAISTHRKNMLALEDHHHTGHQKSGSKPHWPSVCLWFVIYRTDLLGLIYHKYDLVRITMSELPSVFVFAQCHTFASWSRSCCARQSCSACVDYRGQFPWRQPRRLDRRK
jgi:hypothetical protein